MNICRRDRDGFALLALLTVLFFAAILFTRNSYFARDLIQQFYPWTVFTQESLIAGHIPLWNPYNFCGLPFIGNLQSAVFYPMKILFYLMPFVAGYKLYLLFHFLLAGWFMYLLARTYRLAVLPSLLSAVVYAFNGYMVARVEFLSVLGTIVWLPAALLFLRSALIQEKKRIFFLLLLAVLLTVQFLAGHSQMLLFGIFMLTVYVFIEAVAARSFKPLLWLAAAGIGSLLLGCVQFLPALEFIRHSIRGGEGMGLAVAATYSLAPAHLLNLIQPYLFGQPYQGNYEYLTEFWVYSCYIGIVPLLLGLLALFKKPNRFFWWALITLVCSVIMAFGKYTPVYAWLYTYVPVIRVLRYPATILLLIIFICALLSGLGTARLQGFFLDQANKTRIGLLVLLLSLAGLFYYGTKMHLLLDQKIFRITGPYISFLYRNLGAQRFFLTPQTEANQTTAGATLFEAWARRKDKMYANTNIVYHFNNIGGQDVELQNMHDLLRAVANCETPATARSFFNLLGIRYIMSNNEIKGNTYRLAAVGEMKVYENPTVLPRATIVYSAKSLAKEKMLEYMSRAQFQPETEVVLEEPLAEVAKGRNEPSHITWVENEPERIELVTKTAQPGWLVLSDTMFPGWQARVDNKKTPILSADYALRAIVLPAGQHQVVFEYFPQSYRIGIVISLAGWLLLLGVGSYALCRYDKRFCNS